MAARALRLLSLAWLAALAACGGDAAEPPAAPAQPPLARLTVPRLGDPGAGLTFDAGGSQSPGGQLLHWRFSFGDGTPALDAGAPRVKHAYPAEGVFAVAVEVEDLAGRTARAQGTVTVRLGAPACTRDEQCSAADVCRDGRCATTFASAP